jgi:hypothetical protein
LAGHRLVALHVAQIADGFFRGRGERSRNVGLDLVFANHGQQRSAGNLLRLKVAGGILAKPLSVDCGLGQS